MAIGKTMYGKCDQIEGQGYVGTMFFFISYIPIFPLQTMFVTGQSGRRFYGVDLPLSWKSVVLGYARATAWCFLITMGFVGAISLQSAMGFTDSGPVSSLTLVLVAAGSGFAFLLTAAALWASYRVTRATPERREALLALAAQSRG